MILLIGIIITILCIVGILTPKKIRVILCRVMSLVVDNTGQILFHIHTHMTLIFLYLHGLVPISLGLALGLVRMLPRYVLRCLFPRAVPLS